jgi:hypothetical protein
MQKKNQRTSVRNDSHIARNIKYRSRLLAAKRDKRDAALVSDGELLRNAQAVRAARKRLRAKYTVSWNAMSGRLL